MDGWNTGILLSFWEGLFSGAMLVLGRVSKLLSIQNLCVSPGETSSVSPGERSSRNSPRRRSKTATTTVNKAHHMHVQKYLTMFLPIDKQQNSSNKQTNKQTNKHTSKQTNRAELNPKSLTKTHNYHKSSPVDPCLFFFHWNKPFVKLEVPGEPRRIRIRDNQKSFRSPDRKSFEESSNQKTRDSYSVSRKILVVFTM